MRLLLVLVGAMLFMALVMNPLIVFAKIRRNPYPLVFNCLRESGITAFFTRSSAANIPVNMQLCERLGLPEDTYRSEEHTSELQSLMRISYAVFCLKNKPSSPK